MKKGLINLSKRQIAKQLKETKTIVMLECYIKMITLKMGIIQTVYDPYTGYDR